MLITKILDTSVDLKTHAEIYDPDVVGVLMKKLRERFNGRCFSSMLIIDVVEVIRYSDRIMVDNMLTGAAYINVRFKVNGMVLVQGEVVHGCKVTKVLDHNIIISHPYINGYMTADTKHKIMGLIAVDEVVPVIVDHIRYNVGKTQITMSCKPYIPQPFSEIFYNITDTLHTEKLEDILTRLSDEEKLHEKIKTTKVYLGFKAMIYPYKTARKFEHSVIGSKFKEISVKDAVQLKDTCCLTAIDYAVDNYLLISKDHISSELNVASVNTSLTTALSEILLHKLYYLQTLRGFVEHYGTPEKNHKMQAYWKVCAGLKE